MNETLNTDLSHWQMGPYHDALPGPMLLKIHSDGEVIVGAETQAGFLHRGLEKALEGHPWISTLTYADHLDPEGAVFNETVVCFAVEEVGKIPVPPRAQTIRVILLELARVSSHLGYIARFAKTMGAETLMHYVLRDREKVLDLFELASGVRFSLNYLRFGGVSADVTEGFIERVLEVCEVLRIRLKEYNDLFTFNHVFLNRAQGVGVLHLETVEEFSVTGPNARASGLSLDIRKAQPYLSYDRLDFEVPIGRFGEGVPGDVHSRFMIRLREIAQSIEILKQASENMPLGDFCSIRVDREFRLPRGEAYARVESSRGLLGCHLVSNGESKPSRVQFRTPSVASLAVIPTLLEGARLEDLATILVSMDISLSEVDR
jgi:NADH-quinone oxidoreductase subunit D